jgi:endonuclease YncB( thermonuclease family)
MGAIYSYNKLIRCSNFNKRTFKNSSRMAKIIRIYDGDTFFMLTNLTDSEPYYEYSVRLKGLDTPEVRPSKNTLHYELHKEAGESVRDTLNYLIRQNSIFIIDFDKEDKYGRLLGTLYTAKRTWFLRYKKYINLNQWIIDNELALPYDGKTKLEFDEEFLKKCKNKSINLRKNHTSFT